MFTATLPKEEQYAWLWALIFAYSAPEVFTFFRALRICTFKEVKSPTWMEVMLVSFYYYNILTICNMSIFIILLQVSLFEVLHTIGLAILVFWIMPQLDSVRALMLCNGVCFIPSILSKHFA